MRSPIFVAIRFAILTLALSCVAFAQGPEDIQKKVLEAVAKYKEGKTTEAVAAFEALHKTAPENTDVQAWLGFLYLRTDKPNEAIPLLEKASSSRPKDLEILTNLGGAYMDIGDLDKAGKTYEQVSKLNPKLYDAWYNIGTIRLKKKLYAGAIEAYGKALAINGKDPFVHNNVGVAHEGLQEFDKAALAFVRAANLQANNKVFLRNAAYALVQSKQTAKAVPFLERARKVDPQDDGIALSLADAYTRLDRRKEALQTYESLADRMGDDAAFWFNLGVLRAQNSNPDGAAVAYRRTLEIDPNDLDALNNLGLLLFRDGKYEEAYGLFHKLSGLNPTSRDARLNMASCLLKLGKVDDALDVWMDLLKRDSDNWVVRLNVANALWKKGDREGAKGHYDLVLKAQPNSAEALNGAGLYYLANSKLVEAEKAFRSAVRSDRKFVAAYNNLAVTLERLNRPARCHQDP